VSKRASRRKTTVEHDHVREATQRAMWTLGDYPRVARDILAPLGSELVAACGITSGQRVLDVAAGSGNAAIPAAEAGAKVVASDLAPELLDTGRREAGTRGVGLDWTEADAEAIPFDDDEFDVVMSCIGAIFAPHHRQVADELVRVCRPGGIIGMINWAYEGSIAEFFRAFVPYLPPLPPPVRHRRRCGVTQSTCATFSAAGSRTSRCRPSSPFGWTTSRIRPSTAPTTRPTLAPRSPARSAPTPRIAPRDRDHRCRYDPAGPAARRDRPGRGLPGWGPYAEQLRGAAADRRTRHRAAANWPAGR
jgi:SAM-dependent methyltransferase